MQPLRHLFMHLEYEAAENISLLKYVLFPLKQQFPVINLEL